jgi:hypothetical protein
MRNRTFHGLQPLEQILLDAWILVRCCHKKIKSSAELPGNDLVKENAAAWSPVLTCTRLPHQQADLRVWSFLIQPIRPTTRR